MSQVQILSKKSAEKEIIQLLKQHDYVLLGKPNDELIQKVKKRHSRAIQLLIACGDIYVKLGFEQTSYDIRLLQFNI